jgi:hypothetical protein
MPYVSLEALRRHGDRRTREQGFVTASAFGFARRLVRRDAIHAIAMRADDMTNGFRHG